METNVCSLAEELVVETGTRAEYETLAHYHYRQSALGPTAAIFVIRHRGAAAAMFGREPMGVLVATMPAANLGLRTIATGGRLRRADRREELAVLNRSVRCIARVIVEPAYRGIGVGTRLVREAIERLPVPFVEALAVMGHVHPIFERAGMTAYRDPTPPRCLRMVRALEQVGIDETMRLDPDAAHERIESLSFNDRERIDTEFGRFLGPYGKRRRMTSGPERTRFILSRLTERPVYYLYEKDIGFRR
ncbi:MAG: GNAT family N-acetyltransferase [Phycisphaerae bacterium]|nr:GNAT family N-acetyltransferase [Phycisphaerae bacterium]